MSPRTGRPPVECPKSERVTVRLSETQKEVLEKLAIKLGLKKAEVFIKALELLEKTGDYYETGQLLDAIVIKANTMSKIQNGKPNFISDEEWNKRLGMYKKLLEQSDKQILANATSVAKLLTK